MNKIKELFKKHKWLSWVVFLACDVLIFLFLMRGKSTSSTSSSTGGIQVATPLDPTSGASTDTSSSTDGSMIQAFTSSIQSMMQSQQQQNQSLTDALAAQAQATSQQLSAIGQQITKQQQDTSTALSSIQTSFSNPKPSDTSILSFLTNAQSAVGQAVTGYHQSSGNAATQDYFHNQAETTRQNVQQYIGSLGANSGYTVSQSPSGQGYNNVTVTAPNGQTFTL